MKRLLLVIGVAVGMNAGVALAQSENTHENMPGHDNMPAGEHQNMPPGEHQNMPPGDYAKDTKKKQSDIDKNQQPKSDDQKPKGHDQP